MCIVDTPSVKTPDPVQESKTPDSISETKRKQNLQRSAMAGGTWLTGVSGVPTQSVNTGTTTLLGG
jgi:hypothetical protein